MNNTSSNHQWGIGEKSINLVDALRLIIRYREGYKIVLITVILGILVSFLWLPKYQAHLSVQITPHNKTPGNLGSVIATSPGGLLSAVTTDELTTTESELLLSRLFVGKLVDEFNTTIVKNRCMRPWSVFFTDEAWQRLSKHYIFNYFDIRHCKAESVVSQLETPDDWINTKIKVDSDDGKTLRITLPDGNELTGKVGEPISQTTAKGEFKIKVDSLAQNDFSFQVKKITREEAINDLRETISAKNESKGSNIISIAISGSKQEQIKLMAKRLGEIAMNFDAQRAALDAAKELEFLQQQKPVIGAELEEAERKLSQFQKKNMVLSSDENAKYLYEKLTKIETAISELKQKRASLLVSETPSHPEVITADNTLTDLQKQREQLMGEIAGLPEMNRGESGLKRDVILDRELYSSIINTTQLLRLTAEGSIGSVQVIDPPEVEVDPYKPSLLPNILWSLMIGLLVFSLVGGYLMIFKQVLFDPADIERELGLNVYAVVGRGKEKFNSLLGSTNWDQVTGLLNPTDPALDGLRLMNVTLDHLADPTKRCQIIMITGATAGIGKSHISSNLAVLLAAASNQKILLMDSDLRRGKLHTAFSLQRNKGISDVITHDLKLDQVIERVEDNNLDFISTGTITQNPIDLIKSRRFGSMMAELSNRYDKIIIDSAPVLIADTLEIAKYADSVFIVAREAVTTASDVEYAIKVFAKVNMKITGVIYNGHSRQQYKGRYTY
jgi:tyrosine-protein kinase Etk/Wzc